MERHIVVYTVGLVVLIVTIIFGLWFLDRADAPKREAYTALAQCLKDRGVTFYGAFWCPVCAQQKTAFGSSASKKLLYVECSTPDRTEQTQVCQDEQITGYPTWKFPDSMRCGGMVSPEVLAHLAGCPLPEYGDMLLTVDSLYATLVEKYLTERMILQNVSDEEQEIALSEVRMSINTELQARYGTTLEDENDVHHLLAAIAKVVNRCAPEQ